MSRNNDVFQVLIPTVVAVAPVGSTLDALLLGQLGAFDYETNLAVDSSVRNFYFAVGVDDDGAGGKTDINKSSGTHIQTRNVIYLTNQCYVAPVDKVITLSNWVAMCDTEYGIRFEIRNQEAYRLNGYNQVVKYYTTVSPACVPCDTTCPDGDCGAVTADLMDQINNDPDAVITASASVIAGTILSPGVATAGGTWNIAIDIAAGPISVAVAVAITNGDTGAVLMQSMVDLINAEVGVSAVIDSADPTKAFIYGEGAVVGDTVASTNGAAGITTSAVNFAVVVVTDLSGAILTTCPDLIFTVNPATFSNFCDINLNYFFPRQTDIIAVGTEGFVGNSTIETTTEMVYEDGAGYDVKQLEYEAGGWNGRPGPYRVGELIGVAFPGFKYYANQASNYDMIHIQHDQNSVSGWRDDNHFERTIIATDVAVVGLSDAIGAFVNTMVTDLTKHGEVDPIVPCVN